jgi:hypothetical protein
METGICHVIILRNNIYNPPINKAIAEISPSEPPIFPISISVYECGIPPIIVEKPSPFLRPSFTIAKGVAPV